LHIGGGQRVSRSQEILRGQNRNQLSSLHKRDTRAKAQGFTQIVGDEDYRFVQSSLERKKLALQLIAGNRVDRTEGLIHQKDRRIGGESTGYSHSLTLSS
jgi:hypothetical protein